MIASLIEEMEFHLKENENEVNWISLPTSVDDVNISIGMVLDRYHFPNKRSMTIKYNGWRIYTFLEENDMTVPGLFFGEDKPVWMNENRFYALINGKALPENGLQASKEYFSKLVR